MKKSRFIAQLRDDARTLTRNAGVMNEKLVEDLAETMFNTMTAAGILPPRCEYMVAGQRFADHYWEAEDSLPVTRAEAAVEEK